MGDQNKENISLAVSEQEQQLASRALNEFRNGRYDDCLQLLRKLAEVKPNDSRISINKVVTEFYQSGCCKTDELRKQLAIAKKQVYSPGNIKRAIARACLHTRLKHPRRVFYRTPKALAYLFVA